ncbi:stage V sporulation protein AA [Anaerobacillus alkalilacustris]|uniref:Stage V sporulation protein AA n=1 Tax=Anaerobacillus alkalilacustris TaxID=393763 RepID=A0A1S2LDY0_9BACI|nr:stage V sporulation protein AA [Anaerobacillus alkalilacustris]OIJ10722.1 stage V sporulation protein AA [Anaerobacillus alkalilacustris]
MRDEIVYIRLRHRYQATRSQIIKIGDIAQIVCSKDLRGSIGEITIHQVKPEDKKLIVIDIMKVIRAINIKFPLVEVQAFGDAEAIVEVYLEKKSFKPIFFIGVWLLLFTGAGLAIMNFHEDVNMLEVHQKLYEIITGQENPRPLILQIPYSIGLGFGMILFFNHLFKKRINEEPSPLEVEMFNYQQALDHYISIHENSESEKKNNDT